MWIADLLPDPGSWLIWSRDFRVNFLATLLGVGIAFFAEYLWRMRQERIAYRNIFFGVHEESAVLGRLLRLMATQTVQHRHVLAGLEFGALRAALMNPLVYERAPATVTSVMHITANSLGYLTNLLTRQLTRDLGPTPADAAEIRVRAQTCLDYVEKALQPSLADQLGDPDARFKRDPRRPEVEKILKEIRDDQERRITRATPGGPSRAS